MFQIQIRKDRWEQGEKRKVEQLGKVRTERILDGYDINITVERTGNNTKD